MDTNEKIILRGQDLNGKGAMLVLALTHATNNCSGDITIDSDYVRALLIEYTELNKSEPGSDETLSDVSGEDKR